jgi:hypothetical protein
MRPAVVRAKHMTDGLGEPSEPLDGASKHRAESASAPAVGVSRSQRIRLVTLALCLGIAAIGVSVALLSSAGRTDQSAKTGNGRVPQSTSGQAPAASAPSPAAAGSGGSAANGHPSRRDLKLLRWKEGPGGAALMAVEKQMGTAMQDAGLKLYAQMKTACASLSSDVSTARSTPPIPDEAMQRLYAGALAGLAGAAADCRTAISMRARGDESVEIHVNRARLNLARVRFAAMSKKLYLATREILSLHR